MTLRDHLVDDLLKLCANRREDWEAIPWWRPIRKAHAFQDWMWALSDLEEAETQRQWLENP